MLLSPLEYLRHILDESNYILEHSRELTRAQFMQDPAIKRAFVRNIEVIGEATNKYRKNFESNMSRLIGRRWWECVINWCTIILAWITISWGMLSRIKFRY